MINAGNEIDHPIVFIPGDGGSQLEAKLTDAGSPPGYNCDSNSDWFRIWLNVKVSSNINTD